MASGSSTGGSGEALGMPELDTVLYALMAATAVILVKKAVVSFFGASAAP